MDTHQGERKPFLDVSDGLSKRFLVIVGAQGELHLESTYKRRAVARHAFIGLIARWWIRPCKRKFPWHKVRWMCAIVSTIFMCPPACLSKFETPTVGSWQRPQFSLKSKERRSHNVWQL